MPAGWLPPFPSLLLANRRPFDARADYCTVRVTVPVVVVLPEVPVTVTV